MEKESNLYYRKSNTNFQTSSVNKIEKSQVNQITPIDRNARTHALHEAKYIINNHNQENIKFNINCRPSQMLLQERVSVQQGQSNLASQYSRHIDLCGLDQKIVDFYKYGNLNVRFSGVDFNQEMISKLKELLRYDKYLYIKDDSRYDNFLKKKS